ncbi:MAG: hypothetical protein QM765_20110 [Myxococcales bacterium]
MSGETAFRGWPSLSPQNDRSKDRVTKPCSAIFVAYRFALCSFTAPIGCPTTIAGLFPFRLRLLGAKRFPTTFIWYWFLKLTFSTVTFSLT